MNQFIDPERTFKILSKNELEQYDSSYDGFSLQGFYTNTSWDDLLALHRVVILGEAGSGKTQEMKHQVEQLREQNEFAFFVPLEELANDKLSACLEYNDEKELELWMQSQSEAWLFLDSVDELKLNSGKLDQALKNIEREFRPYLSRTNIVISCRPSDWLPIQDLGTFETRLPYSNTNEVKQVNSLLDEELFLSVINEPHKNQDIDDESENTEETATICILKPLTRQQIVIYAERKDNEIQSGAFNKEQVDAFLDELDRRNTLDLARTPLDLERLLLSWKKHGDLGDSKQQLDLIITNKLSDIRDKPTTLSEAKMRQGISQLALALVLSKKQYLHGIHFDSSANLMDALTPSEVLTDWTPQERKELLSCAVFEPASYGRIRFHHRSTKEYLAAECISNLIAKGLPISRFLGLIFDTKYKERVLFPYMEPIATWLAIEHDYIFDELVTYYPEKLLLLGAPDKLNSNQRRRILREVSKKFGHTESTIDFYLPSFRRFISDDLIDEIQTIWIESKNSSDIRELILNLIKDHQLTSLSAIANEVATSNIYGKSERVLAVRTLLSCKAESYLKNISEQLIIDINFAPNKMISSILYDFFPRYLTGMDPVS